MLSTSSTEQSTGLEWDILLSLNAHLILSIQPLNQQPKQLTSELISFSNAADAFEYELTLVFIHLASNYQLSLSTVDDSSRQMKLSSLCKLLDRLANLSVLALLDTNAEYHGTDYRRLRKLLQYVQDDNRPLNLIRGKFGPAFQFPSDSLLAADIRELKDINRTFDSLAPLPRNEPLRSIRKVQRKLEDPSSLVLREYAITVFDTVFKYLKKCKATHKVMFGFPEMPGAPDIIKEIMLDGFISVCSDRRSDHTKWQEARFGASQLKSRKINNFCRDIEESQSDQGGLLLHIVDSKLRNFSQSIQPRRHKFEHPSQSLYSLLTDHLLQRESVNNLKPGRWSRRQRNLLVSTMAQALEYLFESPWMRNEWTSKGIFFEPEPEKSDKSQLPHGPFVLCSADGPNLPDGDKWWQQLPKTPSLILFGMMMMEIDLGRSLEDEVNERIQRGNNLWKALTDIWEEQQNDLEYSELILACLKFHKEYIHESTRQKEEEEDDDDDGDDNNEDEDEEEEAEENGTMQLWARDYISQSIIAKLVNSTQTHSILGQEIQDISFQPEILLSLSQQPESKLRTVTGSSCDKISLAPGYTTISSISREATTASFNIGSTTQSTATSIAEDHSKSQSPVPEPIQSIPMATPLSADSSTCTTEEEKSKPQPSSENTQLLRWFGTMERGEDFYDPNTLKGEGIWCDSEEFEDVLETDAEVKAAKDFFGSTKYFIKMNKLDVRDSEGDDIRIAVIDTGVDTNDSVVKPERKRIIGRSWVGDQDNYTDTCGHGTHIVRVILRTNLSAKILVAKVSETTDASNEQNFINIVKAIKWAVDQDAHIISLSLGFSRKNDLIATALADAMKPKDRTHYRRIVFAASGNFGFARPRAFPANQKGVICIHALSGKGGASKDNPEAPLRDRFGTLGVKIPSWNKKIRKEVWISGSSFATPIAAAIAANILQFARQRMKLDLDSYEWKHLRSGKGMRSVLGLMNAGGHHYDFLQPWQFRFHELPDGWKDYPTPEELSKALHHAIDNG